MTAPSSGQPPLADREREATGFAHPGYAASLSAFGQPAVLPASKGWCLTRRIAGTDAEDGTACHPQLVCADWSRLGEDLARLDRTLVSLSVVIDPFAPVSLPDLHRLFQRVQPFKSHVLVDLADDWEAAISQHHRYSARRAARLVTVGRWDDPGRQMDDWCRLYNHLVDRHQISPDRVLPRDAFEKQFAVPGLEAYGAWQDGTLVAAHLLYVQGDVAYSHLAASDDTGYRVKASYALYDHCLRSLAGRVRWVNLGAGSGTSDAADPGLTAFKRGWSAQTGQAYFCGRIGDADRYTALTATKGGSLDRPFFPAYRWSIDA